MKRLLRKGLCLALGLSCTAAYAQELNFRAVAPRPAVATGEIPVSLGQPKVFDVSLTPIVRGKVQDDANVIIPVSSTQVEGIRFVQRDAPPRPSPLPAGAPGDFVAPAPQIIGSPETTTTIGSPVMGSPHGTVVTGPYVGGPVSSSGCACSGGGGGYSFYDGFIGDDSLGCGNSCSTCGPRWHPFQHIHDFFACGCCSGCCDPRPALWLRGEYLLWTTTRMNLPGLVSEAATPGALLAGGGTVLYGNNSVPDGMQNGGRVTAGFWFPRHSDWGLDASYFFLGTRSTHNENTGTGALGATSTGRPFTEAGPVAPGPTAELVSIPGVPGRITVDTNTRLWGFDANLRRKLCCSQGFWIDGLVGYRHIELQDNVDIQENIGPPFLPGINNAIVSDHFGTRNTFNGAQLGLEAEWRFLPRFTLGGIVKVAGGNMNESINIAGSTTQTFNGPFTGTATQRGGLLAEPSNIGGFSTNRFVIIPEVGVKIGWDITSRWRFLAGYNVMYVSNVVRAGDQIDLRVNSQQRAFSLPPLATGLPPQPGLSPVTPNLPAVPYRTSEFWAQGVSLGLEYRY